MPPPDYYVILSRADRGPMADVWPITRCLPLPTIPVRLAGQGPDVSLILEAVFTTANDRSGCAYALDYRQPIEPPLSPQNAEWPRSVAEESTTLSA